MSKSSTSTQLSQKSAWAKGPPETPASSAVASTSVSSCSQSPATSPNATQPPQWQTNSRRPSDLGQGVSIEDGVGIPHGNAGAAKQGELHVCFQIYLSVAPLFIGP